MKRSPAFLSVLALAFPLAACSEGSASSADTEEVQVTVADDTCEVSDDEADSGKVTFEVTNDGGRETDFFVLAEDGLRVVGTRGGVVPEETAELAVELQPGSYLTACRMGEYGLLFAQSEFTVSGDEVEYAEANNRRKGNARENYIAFVQNEAAEMLPKTVEFAEAYASGNDERAKELYPAARSHYKRIEPIAERFGLLDARIDATEVEYTDQADELIEADSTFTEWLGFHRLEKDLWPPAEGDENSDGTPASENWEPSTPQERRELADALIADVEQLHGTVNEDSFLASDDITIDTIASGALTVLDRMAETAATGEENWWSQTDVSDLKANTEGTRVVFDTVADLGRKNDEREELIDDTDKRFDNLLTLIDAEEETEADAEEPGGRSKLVDEIKAIRGQFGELAD
ncbi:peptidase M75 family protein [Corynebacterium sp. CCUG 69979]|uniref:peptidase M75 family protein n=1 Tax=Corynebacterium sp. CCUG 69979 TaxID=2823890 RepID=UPI002108AA98|nr:peptidase M75 family protein [Corynebacterium sp. CCUG 69979]MCQ4625628.1 peptidase M75 family protein [Corynebacterium sp. CCUG 69979]